MDNGQISLQPFSMMNDEAMNKFSFTELPTFNLLPSLEEINKVSEAPIMVTLDDEIRAREMLHESMRSLFKDINKMSIPQDSVGPFMTGIFQQSRTVNFKISKDDGGWNIRAEVLVDGKSFKFYMQLSQNGWVEADARALSLKSNAEKDAFSVAYNLASDEDGLAVMALSEEQKYLNTDNVNALCGRRSGRKRRVALSYCGLSTDEKVPTVQIIHVTRPPKSERMEFGKD
uniref:Uncharacterized protein n=1 Tax=Romanomermis culicivorax TaxID=13658 RepID=A0A915KL37_ROMCU